MTSYPSRRYLAEYRAATDNEIAVDMLVLGNAGKHPDDVGHIPRAPVWLGRFSNRPALTRRLAAVARGLWLMTAGLPFHALSALRLWRQLRRSASLPETSAPATGDVALALSQRAFDVIAPPQRPAPDAWIVPPWVEAAAGKSTTAHVPLLAFVTTADLFLAFRLAVRFTSFLAADPRRRKWLLQTYTAVPWLLARIALERVDADFVMAEHFDRWAVLADVTTRAKRRAGDTNAALGLVQHGHVGSLDDQGQRVRLRYRLTAVGKLHVYDAASEKVFREDILTRPAAARVEVQRFTPTIVMTPLAPPGRPRVLFVGHPLCAGLQIAVLEQLVNLDAIIYYKPHPIAGLPAACEHRPWQIITDRTVFPEVELLVAYRSTLVTEYEQHGIEAVLHALTNDPADASAIAAQVRPILTKSGTCPAFQP